MTIFLSLLAGLICGIVFALTKLPIPAPGNIAGIVGILGIFIGYGIINLIK